jgi:hypothetical protein
MTRAGHDPMRPGIPPAFYDGPIGLVYGAHIVVFAGYFRRIHYVNLGIVLIEMCVGERIKEMHQQIDAIGAECWREANSQCPEGVSAREFARVFNARASLLFGRLLENTQPSSTCVVQPESSRPFSVLQINDF